MHFLLLILLFLVISTPKLTQKELIRFANNTVDPFQLVEKDVSTIASGIKDLLGSDHPVLETCAK